MELVSLRTDEEIDSLRIGDEFYSKESKCKYRITDITREHYSGRINSIRTDLLESGILSGCRSGHNWSPGFRNNFIRGVFLKLITVKDYDPSQQPFTDSDI